MDEDLRRLLVDRGVVTAAMMREAGLERRTARSARRRGDVQWLWRDCAVWSPLASDPRTRWHAALALAPGTVLCGASAARVWGLMVPREWPEEVVVPRRVTRLRSRANLLVRSRDLRTDESTEIRGLPVTTIARTALDIALHQPRTDAQWVVDQCLARGLDEAAVPVGRRRGTARLRAMLEAGEAASESPLESAVRLLLLDAGLPRPHPQYVVRGDDGGFLARVDLAWPRQRLVLEADGIGWHSAPAPLLRDRWRQNTLTVAGWAVLRATWADVPAPAGLATTVRSLLAGHR